MNMKPSTVRGQTSASAMGLILPVPRLLQRAGETPRTDWAGQGELREGTPHCTGGSLCTNRTASLDITQIIYLKRSLFSLKLCCIWDHYVQFGDWGGGSDKYEHRLVCDIVQNLKLHELSEYWFCDGPLDTWCKATAGWSRLEETGQAGALVNHRAKAFKEAYGNSCSKSEHLQILNQWCFSIAIWGFQAMQIMFH